MPHPKAFGRFAPVTTEATESPLGIREDHAYVSSTRCERCGAQFARRGPDATAARVALLVELAIHHCQRWPVVRQLGKNVAGATLVWWRGVDRNAWIDAGCIVAGMVAVAVLLGRAWSRW